MPITPTDRLLLSSLTRLDHSAGRLDDQTLTHLLVSCQSGDTHAGERVLAAMAFPLASMARRSVQTELAHFVSAAWFVIEGFNTTRTHKVMTNLLLDTLKQVTRDRVSRWDERSLPHPNPELWRQEHRDEGVTAAELIAAARRLHLIDERTTSILQAVYLRGLTGRETAALVGDSPEMVRYRCSRAMKTMRAHQQELVENT